MFATFAIFVLISYLHLMSMALIIVFSIVGFALIVLEGFICGKITSELVHKKDDELNEVLWFWLGFFISWLAILLTLVVKKKENK